MDTQLAIIGAGPGGYVAAIRAAQRGAKVCLIERGPVGGGAPARSEQTRSPDDGP